jgi:hypothetical protein
MTRRANNLTSQYEQDRSQSHIAKTYMHGRYDFGVLNGYSVHITYYTDLEMQGWAGQESVCIYSSPVLSSPLIAPVVTLGL